MIFDFLVGETVTDARVELVEGLPFELVIAFRGGGEEAGRLDGAFEGRGPDGEFAAFGDGFGYKAGEGAGVGFAAFRDVGVSTDFAFEVIFRFAVLGKSSASKLP